MDSLDENEFCETNVKVGAKRTNDLLSFLFGVYLPSRYNNCYSFCCFYNFLSKSVEILTK
jgi:hypothetical protein